MSNAARPSFPPDISDFLPGERKESILIHSLELQSTIGVPDAERSRPQRLLLDLSLQSESAFAMMDDAIEKTIDYSKLAFELAEVASVKQRKLIETLAVDLAEWIFHHYPVMALSMRIRKFILPETEFVGVQLAWTRADFEKFNKTIS